MSLEQKIEVLTAAVMALTAAMSSQPSQASTTLANVAPAATQFPAPGPLPNGMPGGPFGAQPAASPAFAAAVASNGCPFTDLIGCTKYAMDTYYALEAKAAGKGAIIGQLVQYLCGSGSINDLPVAQYPAFYTEMQNQLA
jgi:hypothetical protein